MYSPSSRPLRTLGFSSDVFHDTEPSIQIASPGIFAGFVSSLAEIIVSVSLAFLSVGRSVSPSSSNLLILILEILFVTSIVLSVTSAIFPSSPITNSLRTASLGATYPAGASVSTSLYVLPTSSLLISHSSVADDVHLSSFSSIETILSVSSRISSFAPLIISLLSASSFFILTFVEASVISIRAISPSTASPLSFVSLPSCTSKVIGSAIIYPLGALISERVYVPLGIFLI